MQVQDFIQNMPDDLLSKKGKQLKESLKEWFDLEPTIRPETEDDGSSQVGFVKNETPVWTKE